ncbi:tetratricopeptide repeat protein [Pseudoalteromonas sp. APC 3358]|jgi:tetratricopeptide (TPR) repeat protein|uniref:tetratricopeptide repeat protein n=1 Tax=unclassified Pseudoalteromonas TaxID=194690 RepID=UPI0013FD9441|nr:MULTISPECIES: tetratricopeptide repeat protein [unclassified Pseudoalteromonas]MBG9990549.1 tetratricopeptide repeat protein [Pseudoalteromonas sp. NZS37]MDN3382719.1 tetratricopeptide repeat protein [Pseudoalteromonas sp. APC 3358]
MRNFSKVTALAILMSVTGATLSASVLAAPDYAKIEERKKAKTKIMGERTGKKVIKAFDLYNEEKVDEAIVLLREIDASNDFDKATVNRYLGSMYAQKEKYDEAIKYSKQAVAPDVLNFADQEQTLKLLGDLYAGTEKYQEAKKAYVAWMDFTGQEDPTVYTRIAQANFQLEQFRDVFEPADKAIKLQKEPNKGPFQLKLAAYFELKDYASMVKVGEEIVRVWPDDKKAWIGLGKYYLQTEDYSKGLATMEVAYKNGYFENEVDYKVLSNFYSLNEIPFRAAVTLEKAIKSEKVKRTKQNINAIASNYHRSKDLEKAAKYYEEAAKFDDDAELYRKAGSLLLQSEKFSAAVVRLNKALELGSDKKGTIYSDLAEAYYYQGKYKQAYAAITKAMDDPRTRKFAKGWSTYIKDKAARNGVKI